MIEKQYNLHAGYYYNYTGICSDTDENLTTNKVVDLLNEQHERVKKLKEENEQLKQTIKEVYGILCIDVDVFSDKATEHDINAYIELRELDNKDAYYIAKGTKKAIELLKKVMWNDCNVWCFR